jgi:hypothetical protein
MKAKAFLIVVLLSLNVQAQDEPYIVDFSLSPQELLGGCSSEDIQNVNVMGWGECVGNFFNPSIPNPLNVLKPISTKNFQSKVDYVLNTNIFEGIIRGLEVFVISVVELIFAIIKYLIVFAVRFLFVYLFYISLGFQMIALYLTRGGFSLDEDQKIKATIGLMILGTIYTLTLGGGWLS